MTGSYESFTTDAYDCRRSSFRHNIAPAHAGCAPRVGCATGRSGVGFGGTGRWPVLKVKRYHQKGIGMT